jgi:hypothetical protein
MQIALPRTFGQPATPASRLPQPLCRGPSGRAHTDTEVSMKQQQRSPESDPDKLKPGRSGDNSNDSSSGQGGQARQPGERQPQEDPQGQRGQPDEQRRPEDDDER